MHVLSGINTYKLRLIAVIFLMVSCLVLLGFLPSLILSNPTAHAAPNPASTSRDSGTNASPNVITSGLFNSAEGIQKAATSAQRTLFNSSRTFRLSVISAISTSANYVARGTVASIDATGQAISGSARFIGHTTVKTFSTAADVANVSSIIRPAETNNSPVPTITDAPNTTDSASQPPTNSISDTKAVAQSQPVLSPQWPIHGVITLGFGVPHWPFQPTHTGIDISDGAPWGVTPVHPFEAGTVIEAIHSNIGFGNHVVIAHGAGLTSLYGHMASISVQVGQKVDQATILGYEGSTGASTGVHVHFEIDVNGQPTDPKKYVAGQP